MPIVFHPSPLISHVTLPILLKPLNIIVSVQPHWNVGLEDFLFQCYSLRMWICGFFFFFRGELNLMWVVIGGDLKSCVSPISPQIRPLDWDLCYLGQRKYKLFGTFRGYKYIKIAL